MKTQQLYSVYCHKGKRLVFYDHFTYHDEARAVAQEIANEEESVVRIYNLFNLIEEVQPNDSVTS